MEVKEGRRMKLEEGDVLGVLWVLWESQGGGGSGVGSSFLSSGGEVDGGGMDLGACESGE